MWPPVKSAAQGQPSARRQAFASAGSLAVDVSQAPAAAARRHQLPFFSHVALPPAEAAEEVGAVLRARRCALARRLRHPAAAASDGAAWRVHVDRDLQRHPIALRCTSGTRHSGARQAAPAGQSAAGVIGAKESGRWRRDAVRGAKQCRLARGAAGRRDAMRSAGQQQPCTRTCSCRSTATAHMRDD